MLEELATYLGEEEVSAELLFVHYELYKAHLSKLDKVSYKHCTILARYVPSTRLSL